MMPPGGKLDLQCGATVLDQQVVPADWLGGAVSIIGRKAATGHIARFSRREEFLPWFTLVADRC
eukprot:4099606-Alexandrium_andersonii.AAC.1